MSTIYSQEYQRYNPLSLVQSPGSCPPQEATDGTDGMLPVVQAREDDGVVEGTGLDHDAVG